jgi:hypothetical protein
MPHIQVFFEYTTGGELERVSNIFTQVSDCRQVSPPGDCLSGVDFAARCTSRTPVRDACARPMQDMRLSRIRRKGFLVTPCATS